MSKKIIKFIPRTKDTELIDKMPTPAKLSIPDWYKDIPGSAAEGQESKWRYTGTAKRCTPYLDALTTGYVIGAPQDIGFANIERAGGQQVPQVGFAAQVEGIGISNTIEPEQPYRIVGLPVPKGYTEIPYRIATMAKVATPPGYSLMVTHPFNRYDLPFLTLSGIIDTDSPGFKGDMTITMYVREDFEGVIEQGTPIAQIFPFKREAWIGQKEPAPTTAESLSLRLNIQGKLIRSYQSQFWKKKSYE